MRFERGEAFLDALKEFLLEHSIFGGFFFGLGAMSDPVIAYYDLVKREYEAKRFAGTYEVTNCTGNVARSGDDVRIHCHITLTDPSFAAIGGHLQDGIVGGTIELYLLHAADMFRKPDDATGLDLLVYNDEDV